MAATYNPSLIYTRDYMRLATGDTDISLNPENPTGNNALLQDETYDALILANGYVIGLANACQAIIDLPDPVKYGTRVGGELDFSTYYAGLKQLREDCLNGLIQPPLGATRTGIAVTQLTNPAICLPSCFPFIGFRP